MPTLVRTITYTGPQWWLDKCVDNSFVSLEQSCGPGKSITSKWRDTKAQRRSQMTPDAQRAERLRNLRRQTGRGDHPLDEPQKVLIAWLPHIEEYREVFECDPGHFYYCLDPGDGLPTEIVKGGGIEVKEMTQEEADKL
jgi:hypothetical protein